MASAPVVHKPDSFVVFFDPHTRAIETPQSLPALPFQTTLETNAYRATIRFGARDRLAVSPDNERLLLLAGDVYGLPTEPAAETLLSRYEQRGSAFVHDLNGGFCLLLVDRKADQIMLATDRDNSVKLLVSWDGPTLVASNSLYHHPTANRRLDQTAIACYLASGYIYNDRTPFEGVRMLDGGSVYRLHDGTLDQQRYWRFAFTQSTTAAPAALQHDLSDLLIEAVRARVPSDRPTYLSLSGGYDSRAIVGCLKALDVPDVHCFSYAYGEARPGSDEAQAARFAALCGYEHRLVPSFDGDIATMLRRNGQIGGGMTPPCDEVDAWVRLGEGIESARAPVLLTGDTMFAGRTPLFRADSRMRTVDTVVAADVMSDFSGLTWLQPWIGGARYRDWLAATRAEIGTAIEQVPETTDAMDFRYMLRFQQLENRKVNTWREYYAGRFFRPAHPMLDNAVVDFVLRLPSSLRLGRKLYLATVTSMFPDLFALPPATSASYATYWPAMLVRQKDELSAFIRSQSSPLDTMIEPDILLALLSADRGALTRSSDRMGSLLKRAYRLLRRAHWERIALARPGLYKGVVSADTFLKRALTLRSFLAETGDSPTDAH